MHGTHVMHGIIIIRRLQLGGVLGECRQVKALNPCRELQRWLRNEHCTNPVSVDVHVWEHIGNPWCIHHTQTG